MRLHHLNEKKLKKLNGLTVMSLGQFVDDEDIEESRLNEFAPSWDDEDDNDDPENLLKHYARQFYEADGDFAVEDRISNTLAKIGWEIGWNEDPSEDEQGVFVVRAGDEHGDSYMSWTSRQLQGLEESNSHADTLYFFDVEKGGRSFHHLDLKIMGLKQSLKGKWYYQPGRNESDLLVNSTLRHLEKKLNVPAKPWKRPVAEADFGLGSNFRKLGDKEMQDYLGRVKDKAKLKTDKYKMPFVHGSNIEIKNEEGKRYDTDKLKAAIMQRPKQLLKQNEKMEHSDGSTSVFFNVGLPALKGLAVNEETGDFVIVDTCPGAGACQTYCYAMKGGYVQWKASSMAQTRVLNFLLNDPEGFKKMMSQELGKAERKFAPGGTKVVVRWHDAGDFFSSEYLDVAYSIADAFPNIDFYAYTKMSSVAQADRPSNFKMNFSQGAKRGEEKKIEFHKTKHSRVVPRDMFYDLIAREGTTLIKDSKGRMQFRDQDSLDEFKARLAGHYQIVPNSIITYDEMMSTPESDKAKWNVIVMPGDGDDSANRADVLGTYLLFH